MSAPATVRITTYNIELSRNLPALRRNLRQLADQGTVVFCLQEVRRLPHQDTIQLFLDELGTDWQAVEYTTAAGEAFPHGPAILWNTRALHLRDATKRLLPLLESLHPSEILFNIWAKVPIFHPYPRKAITATFALQKGSQTLRVTSTHLDLWGSAKHRRRQSEFLLGALAGQAAAEPVTSEVICGDFNSFGFFHPHRERAALVPLFATYHFADLTATVPWSIRIFYTFFKNDRHFILRALETLNLSMTRKLDYIWGRNVRTVKVRREEMLGSDHFPVTAELALS